MHNQNTSDVKETMSGLPTSPKSIPYMDTSSMDVNKVLNGTSYKHVKRIYYVNLSKKGSIYIRERNLNVFSISPIMNLYAFSKEEVDPPEQLLIVEEYVFGDSRAALETLHLMELSKAMSDEDVYMEDREHICNDLREVVKTLTDRVKSTYSPEPPITIRFTRYIPLRDIKEDGILHLVNLDITISLDKRMCLDPFPDRLDNDRSNKNNGYNLNIELIDNNDLISTKYTKGAKDVVNIPITKNPLLPNSLRIEETINGEVINNIISDLSIDSLQNYGIYSTREEAITHNDPKIIKLLSNHDEANRNYKDLMVKYEEAVSEYKEVIKSLKDEISTMKEDYKVKVNTIEDLQVDSWKDNVKSTLNTLDMFTNTANKTTSLITKVGKHII